jgi:hypothetical protein
MEEFCSHWMDFDETTYFGFLAKIRPENSSLINIRKE